MKKSLALLGSFFSVALVSLAFGVGTTGNVTKKDGASNQVQKKVVRRPRKAVSQSVASNKVASSKVARVASAGDGSYHIFTAKDGSVSAIPLVTLGSIDSLSSKGTESYSDGGNLLINAPDINSAEALLQQVAVARKKHDVGAGTQIIPSLVVSGAVEGKAEFHFPSEGDSANSFDFSSAALALFASEGRYLHGQLKVQYDGGQTPEDSSRAVDGSRIYLDTGSLIVGDLDRFPVYAQIGQIIVPFGDYSSGMIDDPMTVMGKIKARAMLVGIHTVSPDGRFVFAGRAFAYNNPTKVDGDNSVINSFGVSMAVSASNPQANFSGTLSGGIVRDLASANLFQSTGYGSGGLSYIVNKTLSNHVAGADIALKLGMKKTNLSLEYILALDNFSKDDFSFNGSGAKPSAFNIALSQGLMLGKHPLTASVGYSKSSEAVGLNLPEQKIGITLAAVLQNNLVATAGFDHICNYSTSETGNAGWYDTSKPATDNVLTAKLTLHF